MVRAKFVVQSITRTKHWDKNKGEIIGIKMMPVTGGSEENLKFFEATPSGSVDLGTINEEAGRQFELGKAYYLDFTPAD